jgi:hypothetical protein
VFRDHNPAVEIDRLDLGLADRGPFQQGPQGKDDMLGLDRARGYLGQERGKREEVLPVEKLRQRPFARQVEEQSLRINKKGVTVNAHERIIHENSLNRHEKSRFHEIS